MTEISLLTVQGAGKSMFKVPASGEGFLLHPHMAEGGDKEVHAFMILSSFYNDITPNTSH